MKKVDWGIVLFDTIYIGDGEIPACILLTLRLVQGETVAYTNVWTAVIDYPGEYELSWYNVISFVAPKGNQLNYIIRFGNKKIAYIQDEKSLDNDEVSDMDIWYVTQSQLKDVIDRRELGWDVKIVE